MRGDEAVGLSPERGSDRGRNQPDLVVASSSANNLIPALDKLRVPVLLEPSARSIGDAYVQMRPARIRNRA